jgi:hypothetical protein
VVGQADPVNTAADDDNSGLIFHVENLLDGAMMYLICSKSIANNDQKPVDSCQENPWQPSTSHINHYLLKTVY